ncbi:tail fiber assembly protein [Pseudomonas sp. B21-048]|uniref:tail fiber assembly protein n=1 Tax=Pseudomonas sp. B21-048 TaxID=2895490 RepID=UPI002160E33D|nr:tail fiber assembly protein [Pseudomonas sp. B21-048]UVL00501.1 tail fiber assembly protein [Pseudomonas sp. B21-048]
MTNYLIDNAGVLIGPVEFPVVPGLGVEIPSNAVRLTQPLEHAKPGHVWVMVDGLPEERVDYRGVVYRTDNGKSLLWREVAELPNTVTAKAWPGTHYYWTGDDWELDQSALAAEKKAQVLLERDTLMQHAQLRIAPLHYAEQLQLITQDEQTALLGWMRYCVELNRLEQSPEFPMNMEWPVPPTVGTP